ncbi:MAG: alkaline phosphatase family protein [Chitinophagaceae bacterium]|nr:alkaline phosphatase family protein [Chitinophagaceae bacterium]
MYRKYFFIFYFLFLISYFSFAQPQTPKPKLIVGIVIDQMRWDYLYRFNDLYGSGGFKRLLNHGFSCENTFIPYVPTYTAVGHSCIYTGSVPAINGIVGNDWFEKSTGKNMYCTQDTSVATVGSSTKAGKMSPNNLWTTTITDELRLSTNFKSKVIGIALKDRGAILPAGHSANAAYWYDDKVGKWITSTFYMSELPGWVNNFNSKDPVANYMSKDWNTLLPIEKYTLSTADGNKYETPIKGEKTVTFPHKLSALDSFKYEAFKYTPYAASYTFDFAKTTIENEKMGGNNVTDFLAISISSTDYIGHWFGPNSIEAQDTYLRLDKDIASFLQYLDIKIGKNNYTVFLTADHGAAHVPAFLSDHKIPAGGFNENVLKKELNERVEQQSGLKNMIQQVQNYQVYVNNFEIEKQGKSVEEVHDAIIKFLQQKEYVVDAYELNELTEATIPEPIKTRMINGYAQKRSGDIQFVPKPGYFDAWQNTGTSHGVWNPYDAHIPLLWFGKNIKPGKTNRETYMTDIAPTIAAMLQIQMPNGCVGKMIGEVVGN